MSQLPRALAPWAEYLDLFPMDLAVSVGEMIRRLSVAIGPVRSQHQVNRGELDGFAGIARRGSYEHLMISEWLLAEEAPDEFDRRAAMQEQSFLQPAFRERSGAQRSIALFDEGPDQLGSPRLGHLAALIVLARRAQAARAEFCWGVLQQRERTMFRTVSPHSVMNLLKSRSAMHPTDSDIKAWRDLLGITQNDELWLIGGLRLFERARNIPARQFIVEDVLEPGTRQIRVRIIKDSRTARTVSLDLPDPILCTRLLRDPFSSTAITSQVIAFIDSSSNIAFSPNGRRLIARLQNGTIAAYAFPNSSRDTPGKHRFFSPEPGEIAFAAGWHRRSLWVLILRENSLYLNSHLRPKASGVPIVIPETFFRSFVPQPGAFQPLFVLTSTKFFVRAHGGDLFQIRLDSVLPKMDRVAEQTMAVGYQFGRVLYAKAESYGKTPFISVFRLEPSAEPKEAIYLSAEIYGQVLFGHSKKMSQSYFGLLAARQSPEDWTLFHGRNGRLGLRTPAGALVVGVVEDKLNEGRPGLVLLEEDRRSLTMLGLGWTRSLLKTRDEIVTVTVSHSQPTLAYLTTKGELVIYSLDQDAVLARFTPEEPK